MNSPKATAESLLQECTALSKKFFALNSAYIAFPPPDDSDARLLRMRSHYNDFYRAVVEHPPPPPPTENKNTDSRKRNIDQVIESNPDNTTTLDEKDAVNPSLVLNEELASKLETQVKPTPIISQTQTEISQPSSNSTALTLHRGPQSSQLSVLPSGAQDQRQNVVPRVGKGALMAALKSENTSSSMAITAALARDRPEWHAPWKMYRVIMGHLGWVRSVAIDPSNEWFVTGSADRTIKIWDLASGSLKLTLTGHIGSVRGLAVSDRHPYMFSVGDDKTVKCWDLEYNRVIRHYHGHLSGVYCVALHPALDVIMTGGRDSTVRVWDMRTKSQIHALGGHRDGINAVCSQAADPQVLSGSADSTIRLWDLAAGKCFSVLTNHKKGVRGLALHPREFTFGSASADNIKSWQLPNGNFLRNFSGHNSIINALSINEDGVMVAGADDGSLSFWDFKSAYEFQRLNTIVQPGSLDSEAGIYASSFDKTGSRLITCEADKTIKLWKEDETATPESHPVMWTPNLVPKRF